MREIEFRGKLTNNRGWSYGNLSIKPNNECAIITPDDTVIGKYGKVDIETVGQYTGLKDKNGTKIFEGDIVVIKTEENCGNINGFTGIVTYNIANFELENIEDQEIYEGLCYYNESDYEVLGNIYDNKELLEENK